MHENGAMCLVAMRLEENEGKEFYTLGTSITQLFDFHSNYVDKPLVSALCSQLTSLSDDTRYFVYQTIQLLIVRHNPHYLMIYHAIVEDSITPDLWDDIPQVTNVLGVFL